MTSFIYFLAVFSSFISINCEFGLAIAERAYSSRKALIGDFPAQVSIQSGTSSLCGGGLIRNDLIITAAHCFALDNPISVVACDTNTKTSNFSERQLSERKKLCIHPKFKFETLEYDIAILKVENPFNFSINCHSLPLAIVDFPIGTSCNVSGWGYQQEYFIGSSNLRYVETKISKALTCQKRKYLGQDFKPETMICVDNLALTGPVCQGDSGGPLICNKTIAGIVSFGSSDKCGKSPYVSYAKVSIVHPWIMEYLKTETCDGFTSFFTDTDENTNDTKENYKATNMFWLIGNFIIFFYASKNYVCL